MVFMRRGFTSGGKESGYAFDVAVCKIQARKRYINLYHHQCRKIKESASLIVKVHCAADVKVLCALLKASIATSINVSELAINNLFCACFSVTLSWRHCAVEVCPQSSKIDPTRSVKHKINLAWPGLYWKSPINCHAVACADKVVHLPL